jgi:hypothetical protein
MIDEPYKFSDLAGTVSLWDRRSVEFQERTIETFRIANFFDLII